MSSVHHPDGGSPYAVDFRAVQQSPEFTELRRTRRSFVFPMAVVFLVWYFLYVLLAAFAPEFMAIRVLGNINIGIVLGLLQFVSTFAITAAYVWYSNRKIDPQAVAIREELEAEDPSIARADSSEGGPR